MAPRLLTLLTLLFLLAGCASTAHYPVNPPLAQFDGPRTIPNLVAKNNGQILLALTFSGGGSRASALSYGVLEELANTPSGSGKGAQDSLLSEIDMISAVSGGSITAAYFGLYGDQLFRDFRPEFLERDVTTELRGMLISPETLSRRSSDTFGSGDILDEYFRQRLFGTAPLRELVDNNGPFIQINATDLFKGSRFDFTAEQFALICSDVDGFPVSRAVAASSAVPIIFSPITLANRAGSCNYTPPEWLNKGLQARGKNNRLYRAASQLNIYLDQAAHPYIHLLDGGLADNLGLRAIMDRILVEDGLWNTLNRFNQQDAKHIVLIIVDASALPPSEWEQTDASPPPSAILDAATTTPLANYNFETVEYMRSNLPEWTNEVKQARCKNNRNCVAPEFYFIQLHLEDIANPEARKRLTSVPTDFSLPPGIADELISTGHQLLQDHPEYQRLLKNIREEK